MNKTAVIISAVTAFIIGLAGSGIAAVVEAKGNLPSPASWLVIIITALAVAAKDIRSLLKLPPVTTNGDTTQVTRNASRLPLLLLCVAGLGLLLAGCLGPINYNDPDYIERKAYRVSERVTAKILLDRPVTRPAVEQALASLTVLEGKTNLTLVEVYDIVEQVPKALDGKNAYWVETGVLLFQDELGVIGVRNPPLLQAAVRGMRRGVAKALQE